MTTIGRPKHVRVPEKVVQQQVARLLRLCGFVVRSTSQVRPSMVSVGLPDLIVHHPARGLFAWFEVKAEGGRLSAAQAAFQADALACGQAFVVGGLEACWRFLRSVGLAEDRAGQWTLTVRKVA